MYDRYDVRKEGFAYYVVMRYGTPSTEMVRCTRTLHGAMHAIKKDKRDRVNDRVVYSEINGYRVIPDLRIAEPIPD